VGSGETIWKEPERGLRDIGIAGEMGRRTGEKGVGVLECRKKLGKMIRGEDRPFKGMPGHPENVFLYKALYVPC